MKKQPKKRADHYEKPLHIEGTFDDVINVALGKKDEGKKEEPKQEDKPKEADKKK